MINSLLFIGDLEWNGFDYVVEYTSLFWNG